MKSAMKRREVCAARVVKLEVNAVNRGADKKKARTIASPLHQVFPRHARRVTQWKVLLLKPLQDDMRRSSASYAAAVMSYCMIALVPRVMETRLSSGKLWRGSPIVRR